MKPAARSSVSGAQVAAAKSALAVAQEQVNVNLSDMQRVKTMMDYTRVTAPFAGVITRRYADKGSMIQAGTASQSQAMPLVKLSENSLLRLILPVPESAVPTVHIGQQVEVRVPTMNRSFPGKVERFADKLSLATRTMDTEVDVRNPSLLLIPGMYAEVNLTLERTQGRAGCADDRGRRTGRPDRTGDGGNAGSARRPAQNPTRPGDRGQGGGAVRPERRRHGRDRWTRRPAAGRRGAAQGGHHDCLQQ